MLSTESVFKSALRAFFKTFAALFGIFLAAFIFILIVVSFSGAGGMYPNRSNLTISPNAMGKRDLVSAHAPVLLRLNIHGVIGQGDLTAENVMNCLLDSQDGLLSGGRVKGLLLHINTPGGTVTDSDAIYQAIMDYKKRYSVPVYAYVDGLCASGGMYIASSADKVFASTPSVIGSVGVVLGPTFNFSKLLDTYGVQALTLTAGKDKDMLNPFRPWVPGEDACLKTIVSTFYNRFVSVVTSARPMLNKDALINDYGAQIFAAKKAEELGYIDVADADYHTALAELVKASQIEEAAPYQVFEIEPPHPFLSNLAGANLEILKGKVSHEVRLHPTLEPELYSQFLYFYEPFSQ